MQEFADVLALPDLVRYRPPLKRVQQLGFVDRKHPLLFIGGDARP